MSPGRPRQPTADDLKRWRGLVKAARAVAAQPLEPCSGLLRAADRADHAVTPVGHCRPDSPCVQLVRLGQRFGPMTLVQRREAADELRELADQVAAVLGAPDGEAPDGVAPGRPNRVRADIYG